jgi:Flp pilus assembly protein TadG
VTAARGERGSVAVAGTLLVFALALLLGTALDVARALVVHAELVAVADDAALAGASQLDLDAWRAGRLALDPEQAERVADAEIEASPTLTGSASADGEEVSVELRESFPTMALRLVGIPELEVVARAEASPEAP